ncbi:gamma carbonic anhydrase family protein [uncultured Thiothrix sp.]|uniref:gamma carbonic anhydrase family protein n=1 Tax=uncultured Thiothrix sp. TaxID=223185 RepID=UPI0026241721|nr:gamma carbonic anhydrase family protein [uncultured Thiothrix sp.]
MTIKAFEGHYPEIDPSTWVDETAYVSGRVRLGTGCSVWPMVVIRADINPITIGERTNIQDGSVLHVTHGGPFTTPEGLALTIGDDVIVGHKAILHACTIGNRCLIGMGAIVMDGAVVADETIIAAGSLVPPGKQLEGGYLYAGSPVKQLRPITDKERAFFTYSSNYYVKLAQRTAAS